MTQVIEKLAKFYQVFDLESLAKISDIYDDEVIFEDPVHRICGLPALKQYFEKSANGLSHCEFEFTNYSVTNKTATVEWVMRYRHPRLKNGELLSLNGISLIKFDEKITYQKDLYDMGAMIYEHLPLLGWIIKRIKAKLAK